jgi:hypothetical protein
MSWVDAFKATIPAREKLTPAYRREQTRLSDQEQRLQRQDQFRENRERRESRLYEAEFATAQAKRDIQERKQKMLKQYDDIQSMTSHAESVAASMGPLNSQGMKERAYEESAKYTDPNQRRAFLRAVTGDLSSAEELRANVEERLVQEGMIEEAPDRVMAILKDGSVGRVSKKSKTIERIPRDSEQAAIAVMGKEKFGTPEFIQMVRMMETSTPASRARQSDEDKKPTQAEETIDREFGKEYAEWVARGGYADVQKNTQQLQGVLTKLQEPGAELTGSIWNYLPDPILAKIAPDAVDVKQQVEEVIQRNLRLVLGSQFTEKEGTQLIQRAYNEYLDESVNAARVQRLIEQIESSAAMKDASARWYEKNGTLKGWKGTRIMSAKEIGDNAFVADSVESAEVGQEYNGYFYLGGPRDSASSWRKK